MRLDPSLNLTPEGSLDDLPATLGTTEKTREREYQAPEERPQGTPFEVANEGIPDTHLKTGPTSVAATTQAVFDVEPIDTSSPRINLPNGSPSQPIATATCRPRTWMQQIAEGQISSPRINLPNVSPSQPIATATCRPRAWMQQITKGQINEPTREEESDESNPLEVNVRPEEIRNVLGYEWRVLHPFELPGVRIPTDSTPPNQRRLAENDSSGRTHSNYQIP